MKKYGKYKKSGIQWVGQIPEGWEVCKFKHFANQITTPSKDSNKIGLENIESATGRFVKTNSEFDGNGIHFLQNDIVYGKLRPYLKKVWMAEFEGNAVGDFFVYRCKDNSFPNFVKYLMLSEGFTDVANGSTTGAKMPRVSSSFISNLSCALPSPDEQRDIAAYLDDKTGKIDKATEAINKQIDDLRAYRQSLISETVTKGLNPDTPMKDSGIQWIGQIPKHWKTKSNKHVFNIIPGCGFKINLQGNPIGDFPFFKAGDLSVTGKFISESSNNVSELNVKEERYKIVPKKSILFAKIGESVRKNNRKINTIPCIVDNNCAALSLKLDENIDYYYYLFSYINMEWFIVSGTIPYVNIRALLDIRIPTPPLSEQEAISAFLDRKTAKIDEAIKALEAQRDDLALLKQSLISEAVTGKVDVRGWNSNNETRN